MKFASESRPERSILERRLSIDTTSSRGGCQYVSIPSDTKGLDDLSVVTNSGEQEFYDKIEQLEFEDYAYYLAIENHLENEPILHGNDIVTYYEKWLLTE